MRLRIAVISHHESQCLWLILCKAIILVCYTMLQCLIMNIFLCRVVTGSDDNGGS